MNSESTSPARPGIFRRGSVGDDDRVKRSLADAMAQLDLAGEPADPGVDPRDLKAVEAWTPEAQSGFEKLYEALPGEFPGEVGTLTNSTAHAVADDGTRSSYASLVPGADSRPTRGHLPPRRRHDRHVCLQQGAHAYP